MAQRDRSLSQMQRRKQGQRTALTFLSVIGGVLFLIVIFWYQATNTIPKIAIPNPPMPWRNAHDAYVAAGNSLIDNTKIGYAIGTKHSGQGDDHDYTQAQKEALVAENAGVLKKLRASLKDPYMAPPARSFNTLFPYYVKFRGMARLLALEQQVKAAHGDWSGAVDSGLDAMTMGAQVGHGAVMIGSLVGIACQSIGRRHIWDEVDQLNVAQSRHAAQRLERIMAAQVSFADTIQEEEWLGQAGLMEAFRKSNGRQDLLKSLGSMATSDAQGQAGGRVSQMMMGLKLALTGPRGVILNYTRYMDALRVRNRARYGARGVTPALPDDPINQILVPVFAQAECKDAANEAENALLLVTLALHAYHLEHHAYPNTLAELGPISLKKPLQDPFGPTGTLQYHRDGAKYLLYSVGPDGKDDGGEPIDDPSRVLKGGSDYMRYMVQLDSKGDIVAGVNRY